ncbi:uncharacterized protein LOC130805315 isoform X5 [Amaranthus tricolor]|uniref:uncharacterized protein LOC130805315 isoform X5 n=1 Tax=Amaranthus tricolor TaxID=29722 RepID=UPI00258BE828|nr:uncharacterized protein LOC130805315 isoform X5 [Amaranthus tricolor]
MKSLINSLEFVLFYNPFHFPVRAVTISRKPSSPPPSLILSLTLTLSSSNLFIFKFFSEKKALLMATIDPDGGYIVHSSRPQKKLKSIPCLDYPGDHYIDRDQIVDEEEESDTPGYLEGPPRRVATLANLSFYKPLAEKALTYYNSKECTNLLLKEVLVADRQHQPETVVCMNFIARSEDDSKLFYFFAELQDGPYPEYHDVKDLEDFKEPQPSDFQVKELCSLETHDSGASLTFGKSCSPSIYHLAKASRKIEINSLVDIRS